MTRDPIHSRPNPARRAVERVSPLVDARIGHTRTNGVWPDPGIDGSTDPEGTGHGTRDTPGSIVRLTPHTKAA
jgi:hypothetical protein